LRATAQDREIAAAIGVRVNVMIAATFALATALAGAAGLLLADQFFVTPTEGSNLILKAYIAVTIGGWGRIGGAVLGALLIALFEVVASAYTSYALAETGLYLCLLAILIFRPQGLLGEATGQRA
jgi:branched-chain amino acid transport system permease protein